jgi:GrpB-like predicted nucleotidyltransferase (UPF0157 family)
MVTIIPYQANWPAEFQAIAGQLRQGLGGLALRIDHIGSTSVPGLAAKDIIDLQISVAALDEPVRAALHALGYQQAEGVWGDHVPPGFSDPQYEIGWTDQVNLELPAQSNNAWAKWYFHPPEGQRPTHTHVRVLGRPNQRYPLLFRDYLRAHPKTAAAYAELKRRLAAELRDPTTYPDVKDPAVDLIYLAAEDWAAASGWQPGPSDA